MIRTSAAAALTVMAFVAGGAAGTPAAAAAPLSSGPIPQFWESGSDADDLGGLLLKENRIADLVGVPSVKVLKKTAKFFDGSSVLDTPECIGAWAPAQAESYNGSGSTGVRSEVLAHDKLLVLRDRVIVESVVSFPSPAQASASLDQAANSWKSCADRQVETTAQDPDGPQNWQFGQVGVSDNGTVITLQRNTTSTGLSACERAMGGRNNIAIDVMVCGDDPTGQAAKIVPEISKGVQSAG